MCSLLCGYFLHDIYLCLERTDHVTSYPILFALLGNVNSQYSIYMSLFQLEHISRINIVLEIHFSLSTCFLIATLSLYGAISFCLLLFCTIFFFFFFFCFIFLLFSCFSSKPILDDKTTEERAHSFKHLSKSASELDSRENYTNVTQPSPTPQRSGRSVAGVLQRTHGFLSTLKVINVI